jgi:hypothetical protein
VTDNLVIFKRLMEKWSSATDADRIDYYHEEMAEIVKEMTAWEAKRAYEIMQEGCRDRRNRKRRGSP